MSIFNFKSLVYIQFKKSRLYSIKKVSSIFNLKSLVYIQFKKSRLYWRSHRLRMSCLIVPTFGLSSNLHWKVELIISSNFVHCNAVTVETFSSRFESPFLFHPSLGELYHSYHHPLGELYHLLPVNHRLHGAFCHHARRRGLQTLCWYLHHIDVSLENDDDVVGTAVQIVKLPSSWFIVPK